MMETNGHYRHIHAYDSVIDDRYSHLYQLEESISSIVSILTYVWIDGCEGLRSKIKVIDFVPSDVTQVPAWAMACDPFYSKYPITYEGKLRPVKMYRDPFGGANDRIVLCDLFEFDDTANNVTDNPFVINRRHSCERAIAGVTAKNDDKPQSDDSITFSITQTYFMFQCNGATGRKTPLGWPEGPGFPAKIREKYYCGVGADRVAGRASAEAHYRACLRAGVNIIGECGGSILGSRKFTIGPNVGTSIGDDLWIARYLLHRMGEKFGVRVSFDERLFPLGGEYSSIDFSFPNLNLKLAKVQIEEQLIAQNSSNFNAQTISGYPSDVERRFNREETKLPNDKIALREIGGKFELHNYLLPSNIDPYLAVQCLISAVFC